MTNHPNRKLTPLRKAFLLAALGDNGRVYKANIGWGGRSFFRAGHLSAAVKISNANGEVLCDLKLIERHLEDGSMNTKRWGHGYQYRLTEAGRAAIN